MKGDARSRVAIAALGFMLGAATASADTGVVVVGGTLDTTQRDAVEQATSEVASSLGWMTPTQPLTTKETELLLACKDPNLTGCTPSSMKTGELHNLYVVIAEVKPTDTGPEIVLTGRLVSTDPPDTMYDSRSCGPCAIDRLRDTARTLAAKMLRHSATESGHTRLDIKSEPAGAMITLDGNKLGPAGSSFATFPGKHVLVLEKDGYRTETKDVDVVENQTTAIDVTLVQAASSSPTEPEQARPALGKWLVGSGGALVVGGLVLVLVNQEPSPSEGRHYLHTAPLGYTVGAIGLATAAIGAYFWIRSTHAHRSAPSAFLAPGGGGIAWSGSF